MAITDLIPDSPDSSSLNEDEQLWLFENFNLILQQLQSGVSGSFTAGSGETITVKNGIITGIV